jgi:alpha-beta hydrolase superfamily lysophospholipase
MFSWLNAKRSHVDKYASVYQREGVDVVHVFMTPRRVMVGSDIEKAVEEVLGYVTAEGREQRPLLVHGISVGGLIYTELVATILAQQQKQAIAGALGSSPLGLQQRIKGTVMDSIVDVHHAPRGISRAVTTNSYLRRFIAANVDFQMNRVFRGKFER